MENPNIHALDLHLPEPIASQVNTLNLEGFKVDSVNNANEILGTAQGVATIIKLALIIKRLLKNKGTPKVQLSEQGSHSYIEIDGAMSDDDAADAVKDYFIVG